MTFRTEESARAWAVVDARARELRAEGLPGTLEELRADALLDLVEGRATIDVDLHVMVRLDELTADEPARSGGSTPLDAQVPVDGTVPTALTDNEPSEGDATPVLHAKTPIPPVRVPCAADDGLTTEQIEDEISVLEAWLADLVSGPAAATDPPSEPSASPWWWRGGPVEDGDLVEVTGLGYPGPVHVSRSWLLDVASDFDVPGCLQRARTSLGMEIGTAPGAATSAEVDRGIGIAISTPAGDAGMTRRERRAQYLARRRERRRRRAAGEVVDPVVVACDPVTGALVDVFDELGWGAYRPSPQLEAFVKARDGHCRFPGCTVHASFCDLDHVRPWQEPEPGRPQTGPTTSINLICLCRRHHRVKQTAGWHVRLEPDGTVIWTDPRGRKRTTLPVDHLSAGLDGARSVEVAPDLAAAASEASIERRERERRRLVDQWETTHPFSPEQLETEQMLREVQPFHAMNRYSEPLPGTRPDGTPRTFDFLVRADLDKRLNDPWGWGPPPRRPPRTDPDDASGPPASNAGPTPGGQPQPSRRRWGDDYGDPPF